MPKKIIMITQARGGAGKSTLTFLLAEKHKHAIILDLDDATSATSRQLAYRGPNLISFLDPSTQRIDRSAFNSLFESVAQANKELYLGDLGASVAEQLPKYLTATKPENVKDLLVASDIELQIVCVVCGGNNFKSTMNYLSELIESAAGIFRITAAYNRHYMMSDEQLHLFHKYCKENDCDFFSYDLINDRGELALRTAEEVLLSGKGLSGLSPFKAVYFKGCLENLPI